MQESEQINILQNRIAELELENKNLHEIVAYLTKKTLWEKLGDIKSPWNWGTDVSF